MKTGILFVCLYNYHFSTAESRVWCTMKAYVNKEISEERTSMANLEIATELHSKSFVRVLDRAHTSSPF